MNPDTNYIRLRGLPFAAKEQDVRDFLQDDREAVKEAQKLDRNEINGRYIEVFSVSDAELLMMIRHGVIKGSGGDADSRYASNFVVRLRGLPYSATIDDIKEFFSGLEVADAVIDKEPGGRPSGEAFVRLATKEYAELALERSKNYMGSRYVEVFRSSADEMDNSYYAARGIPPPTSGPVPLRGISPTLDFRFRDRYADYGRYGGPIRLSSLHPRPSPYDRPYYDRDRYYRYGARYDPEFDEAMYDPTVKVFMRGLPYSVTTLDIEEFFRPLNCVEIKLGYNEERRLSGDALVTFSTMAEAREALSRNKNNMGTRIKKRKRTRISEGTKMLLQKRRAMKKENQMDDEYAALCKQIRTQMKKDFEEYRRWKKGKTSQENTENMLEDETASEDFEREMEEEFLVENTGKEDAISLKNFGIMLKKSTTEENAEISQEAVQQNMEKKKKQAKVEQELVEKPEEHLLNLLCTADASKKANTGNEQHQKIIMSQERAQEAKASGGDDIKLKKTSDAGGVLETMIGNEIEKMQSDEAVQANDEKCAEKERIGQPSSVEWKDEQRIKGRYIELFPATNIPHPIKTVTFRTVSGAPTRLTSAPRPLYSSFAEDEEAAYASGVGGQQYYNDQYEGRQSKYGRDWGEPTRTTW
ncbi:RNA recognition motif family protein [Acanthocheilonema viteae]